MHKKTHTKPVQLFTNFSYTENCLVFMQKMPFIEYSKMAEQSKRCQKGLKRRLEQVNKIGRRLL